MVACVRSVAAALAMVSVSFAAVAQVVPPGAQVVPPSDQPGRERERFERPPVPLAQPGGPAISVPGIEAPPGAAETKLVIRQIRIVGATIYTTAQLLNEVTNPNLWSFPLPGRLQTKLQNIPAPAGVANFLWGWRKLPSTEITVPGNFIEITTEYWLEHWSTFYYTAA